MSYKSTEEILRQAANSDGSLNTVDTNHAYTQQGLLYDFGNSGNISASTDLALPWSTSRLTYKGLYVKVAKEQAGTVAIQLLTAQTPAGQYYLVSDASGAVSVASGLARASDSADGWFYIAIDPKYWAPYMKIRLVPTGTVNVNVVGHGRA